MLEARVLLRVNGMERMLGMIIAIVLMSALVLQSPQANPDRSLQAVVEDVLLRIDEHKMTWKEAEDRLNAVPDDALVPALVDALNRSPRFVKEGTRAFLYHRLARSNAASTEKGFQQFVAGLSDPEVSKTCAEALLDAPKEKQEQVIGHIRHYLQTTKQPQEIAVGSGIDGVLRAIARKGEDAIVYVDVIDTILHDTSRVKEVRRAAAGAIVEIKPLAEALKHFQNLDPVGMEAAITAWPQQVAKLVTKVGGTGQSYYDENRAVVTALRELVLQVLQSPRAETRAAAFEPMIVAYGPEIVLIRSPEDYEFNPQLRPILQNMAANDPDPGLRERAAKLLDPEFLELKVARLLRERARAQKHPGD